VLHQQINNTGLLKIHGEHHGDYKDLSGLENHQAQIPTVSAVLL